MSYSVTIRRSSRITGFDSWVAFDDNGDWRTTGDFKPELSGMELALYLFHPEEVESVSVDADGRTTAVIKEF